MDNITIYPHFKILIEKVIGTNYKGHYSLLITNNIIFYTQYGFQNIYNNLKLFIPRNYSHRLVHSLTVVNYLPII